MARIVIEIIPSSAGRRDLHVFDKSVVEIGRGYGSDLILSDPHVSVAHALLRLTDDGQIQIEDLTSRNGIFLLPEDGNLRAKQPVSGAAVVPSGTSLLVGNTFLRVFLASHPMPPSKRTQPLSKKSPALQALPRLGFILGAFFLIYYVQIALNNPLAQVPVGQIIFGEVMILAGISLWAGLWTLLGRVIRHRARFREHFIMTCIYSVAMIPIMNVSTYTGFVFANVLVEEIIFLVLGLAAFAWLLYGHMTYATHMTPRGRVVSSVGIPLVFILLLVAGQAVFENEFSTEPPYYGRLKPPFFRPVKVYQIDDVLLRMGDVFDRVREEKTKEE